METTNTSRAERVQANLNFTCQAIKDNKTQPIETSLAIISQCQIDISYTLASMLDEMRENKVKSIPLDEVKKTREEIVELDFDFGDFYDHTESIRDMILPIIDKLIAESEGDND